MSVFFHTTHRELLLGGLCGTIDRRPGVRRKESLFSSASSRTRFASMKRIFENQDEYDSQWAAICSIAEEFGYSQEALRKWVRQSELDSSKLKGLRADERARMKELE